MSAHEACVPVVGKRAIILYDMAASCRVYPSAWPSHQACLKGFCYWTIVVYHVAASCRIKPVPWKVGHNLYRPYRVCTINGVYPRPDRDGVQLCDPAAARAE